MFHTWVRTTNLLWLKKKHHNGAPNLNVPTRTGIYRKVCHFKRRLTRCLSGTSRKESNRTLFSVVRAIETASALIREVLTWVKRTNVRRIARGQRNSRNPGLYVVLAVSSEWRLHARALWAAGNLQTVVADWLMGFTHFTIFFWFVVPLLVRLVSDFPGNQLIVHRSVVGYESSKNRFFRCRYKLTRNWRGWVDLINFHLKKIKIKRKVSVLKSNVISSCGLPCWRHQNLQLVSDHSSLFQLSLSVLFGCRFQKLWFKENGMVRQKSNGASQAL